MAMGDQTNNPIATQFQVGIRIILKTILSNSISIISEYPNASTSAKAHTGCLGGSLADKRA